MAITAIELSVINTFFNMVLGNIVIIGDSNVRFGNRYAHGGEIIGAESVFFIKLDQIKVFGLCVLTTMAYYLQWLNFDLLQFL